MSVLPVVGLNLEDSNLHCQCLSVTDYNIYIPLSLHLSLSISVHVAISLTPSHLPATQILLLGDWDDHHGHAAVVAASHSSLSRHLGIDFFGSPH
jgi:hypothetical protein